MYKRTTAKIFGNATPALVRLTCPGGRCQGKPHAARGHAIGNYVVDLCSPRKKLIIELDGSQHLGQHEYDQERTRYLESQGYQIIRFWNRDAMKDVEGVLLAITQKLEAQP